MRGAVTKPIGYRGLILLAITSVSCLTSEARAQDLRVEEDSVVILARLPVSEGTVERSIRLTGPSVINGAKLTLLAEDLRAVDQGSVEDFIDRGNVSLSGGVEPVAFPANATIAVTGVERSGTFRGSFVVSLATPAGSTADTVTLRVIVRPDVELSAAVPEGGYLRANCSGVGCPVARGLIHGLVDTNSLTVRVSPAGDFAVTVEEVQLVLVGALSGEVAPLDPQLMPTSVPPGGSTLTVDLPPDGLRPDAYSGHLAITVADVPRPIEAELSVAVRHGPIIALVVLLIGIGLSRCFVKIGKTEGAEPKLVPFSGFVWRGPAPNPGIRFFAWFTGIPWPVGNATAAHWSRWLVFGVLIVAAGIEGTQLLYVNDATFGDTWITDYAGVFLWPFTADVILRGLGNLKWPLT